MGRFVKGENRSQSTLLRERLDDYVAEDNLVRLVDLFVDNLDRATQQNYAPPRGVIVRSTLFGAPLTRRGDGTDSAIRGAWRTHLFRWTRRPPASHAAKPVAWSRIERPTVTTTSGGSTPVRRSFLKATGDPPGEPTTPKPPPLY